MTLKLSVIAFSAVLLACNGNDSEPEVPDGRVALVYVKQATTAAGGTCVDPAVYGALPDDGEDDRAPVQQAIDDLHNGGTICFRSGTYQFTRLGGTTQDRSVSLLIRGAKNIHLTGAGRSTVLEMNGDGESSDWYLIHIRAAPDSTPVTDIEISNLTLSGAHAANTEEQTHLVGIGAVQNISIGTVEGVSIHDVYFYHPFRKKLIGDSWVNEQGGDCIRILGAYAPNRLNAQGQPDPLDKRSRKILISHNQFIECDRSSIGVQRGVFEVIIDGNLFVDVGDQHLDMEPTGLGGIGQFVISNNIFMGGRQGDYHVTIVGNDEANPGEDIVFADNVLVGRGLKLMNVERVHVNGNFITYVSKSGSGSIDALKYIDELSIANNNIHRLAGSIQGPVIRFVPHNSGRPGRSVIRGNQVYQEGNGNVIELDSVQNVSVSDNDIYYSGTSETVYAGVRVVTTRRPCTGLFINHNRMFGKLLTGIQLSAVTANPFGTLTLIGNATEGAQIGVKCSGTFTKPIVHSSYNYDGVVDAMVCPHVTLVQQRP